jgi:septum formation protein
MIDGGSMTAALPRRIILASRSPRRLELARAEGWDVRVAPAPEEAEAAVARGTDEPLESFVRRAAHAKATAIAATGAEGLILACDTLAELDGEPLGKPVDRADARRMLEALSGREHRVVSGVCLWRSPGAEPLLGDAESVLEMDPFDPGFLDWYLDSGLWQGKAGACGFQDERLPLRLVSGSPSNVVGLPLELVRHMLADLDRQS